MSSIRLRRSCNKKAGLKSIKCFIEMCYLQVISLKAVNLFLNSARSLFHQKGLGITIRLMFNNLNKTVLRGIVTNCIKI
jgi:hypothetical protein